MGKRIGTFGLVNYIDHPTNKQFKVFNFNSAHEALLFEEGLKKENIWYERDEEEHEESILYLFAVKDREFSKAQQVNFMVSAQTRKNIIPNVFLRYFFLLVVGGIIALALIGYLNR